MHLYCRYVLPLLLATALPVGAQLTLSNAVATALTGNPGLKAAREQIAVSSGRALQARAWENPELELSSEDIPVKDNGFSDAKNMIGISQKVPFPGKKSLDAKIGAKDVTAAEWTYRAREAEFVREVKSAFYRALAAREKLTVDRQLAELAQSTTTVVRKRVEAGDAAEQEQLRAEVEQERVGVELTASQREWAEARKSLAALVGRDDEPAGDLAAQISRPAQLAARQPFIQAAMAGRERAELELRRAKLDPWPDVRIGVSGGYDGAVGDSLMELRLSFPLPVFDRAQGRKREARALADMAQYDVKAAELRLNRDLAILDARLLAAGEQVQAYQTRILPKAESAARLVRSGFESGKFNLLDVLDTQRTAAEVRRSYYDKLLELNLAAAELEALAGTQTKE